MGLNSDDFIAIESYWRDRTKQVWKFICPLCKSPRQLPFSPKPGSLRHIAQILLSAAFFTLLTWKWLKWKGMVSFVPFWTIFEIIYRWKVRSLLSCQLCGFDPYLFAIDDKKAKQEIEAHWRKKFAEKGIPYPDKGPIPSAKGNPPSPVTNAAPEKST